MAAIQIYTYTFTLMCGEQETTGTGSYATANRDASFAHVTQQIKAQIQAEYGPDYEVMVFSVRQIYPRLEGAR